ncbi:phosphatase PAP2 family protein [Lewinella sp. IMCC34191]|uniref:phosphatase PAP2 family protein n=1 Tax=Lewinella sp. IMCC34191 TaxID=2259172 RepID=UPI000E254784|nr:phosphatase PAP2 family protein [Lewinella sp. IMCC34191]
MRAYLIRYYILLHLLLLVGTLPGQAQLESPYQLSLPRELGISLAGAGSVTAGYFLNHATDEVVLSSLSLPKVPSFDRTSLGRDSESAATGSDIVAYGSLLLPVTLMADKRMATDVKQLTIIFAETMLLNQGLTDIIKGLAKRPRPYLYDASLPADRVVSAYDRSSFLSNHTSTVAAATFFVGRVFADYHPDSKLKPYVWVATATLPAVGGLLRVRAGQHFPSDVVAGYALGAIMGYTIPVLHRRKGDERKWTLTPLSSGMLFTYQLN